MTNSVRIRIGTELHKVGGREGRGVHYLDKLEKEPLYMVVFSLQRVLDLVHWRASLHYVFKKSNGFGVQIVCR